jgi:rhodanese-related sulfurtransferase/transcriptional regulator with XRE-family HTH domain
VKSIGPQELEALIAAGEVTVIDVREASEWMTGHIPAARHVPLAQVKATPGNLPRAHVVFVCARGARSATAAEVAEADGVTDVYSLAGGTGAWIAARLPVIVPVPGTQHLASGSAVVTAPPETAPPDLPLDAIVGANLRARRTQLGISLDELAAEAGVSRTLLGQIELGRTEPSIGVVWRIATALGLPFSSLLRAEVAGELRVLHRAGAKVLQNADGRFSSRALFPLGEPVAAEFYELRVAPHSREDADAHRPGTRENLIVASGRLHLHVGTRAQVLETGDAVLFAADVPHSYVNLDAEACVLYLVMTYADQAR